MIIILLISFIFFILANIMMMLATILSKKSFLDREKSTPFECGFDPKSSARIPFSLHFFLITVIFLIFDIEIALVFPMITTFLTVNLIIWTKINYFFLTVLILGLYHEWNQNMLKWTN